MSLTGVIASFATGTYTCTRRAAGTYTLGRYTAGALETFSIVASIQPATGRVLVDSVEGKRGDEILMVLSATELKVLDPAEDSDRVSYDGEDYVCIKSERWQAFGDTHWRSYIARRKSP